MSPDNRTEVTRREVNVALLATAFAAVAGLPATASGSVLHLFDFAIAGGHHHALAKHLPRLNGGVMLELRREPDNPFDKDAIAVHEAGGDKLGYVPRAANTPIARLLDRGAPVRARIVGTARFQRGDDLPADLVFTSVADGEPVVRLTHEAQA